MIPYIHIYILKRIRRMNIAVSLNPRFVRDNGGRHCAPSFPRPRGRAQAGAWCPPRAIATTKSAPPLVSNGVYEYNNRNSGVTTKADAVVVGGGIAGLLTAHVLSQRLDRVVLVDKDDIRGSSVAYETFPETAHRRPGVPHLTQPHQLIMGAIQNLDALMPDFRTKAIEAGGLDLDLGQHVLYYDYDGFFPRKPSGLKGLGVSRRFVEELIRDRVFREAEDRGNLSVVKGKVADFTWDQDTVTGISLTDQQEINADLVIDTSGRSSETACRLEAHGLPKPRLISVNPSVGSASRMVKRPANWEKDNDWYLLVCKSQPHGTRGGTLLPTEHGYWQVTLAELGGKGPETTDEGFLEFARTLPDQTMYNVLKQCEPVTNVVRYMAMRNEMVCYHEIPMPRGLLIVGDAFLRLNALYGQGIAASSMGVLALQQTLDNVMRKKVDERERKEALSTLGTQFQPILAKKLKFAWQFAVKTDIKYQTTVANYDVDPNSLSDRLISNVLLSAAQADPTTYHHLLRVAHLTATPLSLVADPRTWKPLLKASVKQLRASSP